MTWQIQTSGKWFLYQIQGRLDGKNAPGLQDAGLAEIAAGRLWMALDLSKLEYVSSAGLRVFLTLYRNCTERGGGFALLAPGAMVREVLEVSGFATVFPIVQDPSGLTA